MEKNIEKIYTLFKEFEINEKDQKIILNIIEPIFIHDEFQKRLNSEEYPHHGKISLGEHILKDTLEAYLIAKLKISKGKQINLELTLIIAMFHDLYELPWQNNNFKKQKFTNAHGFIHPIEAAINSIIWYPEYFKNLDNAKIIIDGILHHMAPFPLRCINNEFKDTEINNIDKVKLLDNKLKKIISDSTKRRKLGNLSFAKSLYIEGKIVSRADKIISIVKDLKSFNSLIACITGKNPDLKN